MEKRILSLGLAGILIFTGFSSLASPINKDNEMEQVLAETEIEEEITDIEIEGEEIKVRNTNKIKIMIPKIRGFKDGAYEKELNSLIRTNAEKDIELFEKEIEMRRLGDNSELNIDYDIKSRGDIISIEIKKYEVFEGQSNGQERVSFYNIDVLNNKTMKFKEAFQEGSNYKEILEKEINSQLEIEGISELLKEDQEFYIDENGDFVIVIQEFEIEQKDVGIKEVRIELENIRDVLVEEAINEVEIYDKEIKLETRQDVSIIIPQIRGLSSKVYENELNNEIQLEAKQDIKNFEKILEDTSTTGSSELKINYDIKYEGRIESLVVSTYRMISGEANGLTRKDYYNIDTKNNKTLKLKDLFRENSNYKDLINKEIKSQIKKEKEDYFKGEEAFKSIDNDQGFYFDNIGNIMIEFPIGKIAPRSTGTPVFRISNHILKEVLKEDIASKGLYELETLKINDREIKLNSEMYFSDNGNLMMPLSEIVKKLEYKVKWDGETRIVTLLKGNNEVKVSLKENIYNYNKSLAILEEKAKSVEGVTYVPAKFFEEVLKLETVVEKTGILNIKQ